MRLLLRLICANFVNWGTKMTVSDLNELKLYDGGVNFLIGIGVKEKRSHSLILNPFRMRVEWSCWQNEGDFQVQNLKYLKSKPCRAVLWKSGSILLKVDHWDRF